MKKAWLHIGASITMLGAGGIIVAIIARPHTTLQVAGMMIGRLLVLEILAIIYILLYEAFGGDK